MRAAQLDANNVVINFAEVGGFDGVQFIDPLDSVMGSVWNGSSFTHPQPEPVPQPRQMPSLDFFALFTQAEQTAIATVAMQNPQVFLWFQMASAADFIDLDSQKLQGGMAGLLAAGLITQERHDHILQGLPPA
jgi:hypothetical protein